MVRRLHDPGLPAGDDELPEVSGLVRRGPGFNLPPRITTIGDPHKLPQKTITVQIDAGDKLLLDQHARDTERSRQQILRDQLEPLLVTLRAAAVERKKAA